jgi:hypothetical protein
MRDADAASTQTVVQLLHPDWGGDQVADEVERIESSRPADPLGFGVDT